MKRFFLFLMLLTSMIGLDGILQTAKAAYTGYQVDEGYYYLKSVDWATTKPSSVAKFDYLKRGDGKQYPYIVHGSADTELQYENPGQEMYPYLFKVELNEEGGGYTFKNMQSSLYIGLDNGAPSACLWQVAASKTPCYFTIEYDEDKGAYRFRDVHDQGNPYIPYLATGNESFLWYAETTGKDNTYWYLIQVKMSDEALQEALDNYDTILNTCTNLSAKIKAGNAPGYMDSQESIDAFKAAIDKVVGGIDKTSLESVLAANIALNNAYADVRAHINQIDPNMQYVISSAATKAGMNGQPMYFNSHNTYIKAGDYAGADAKADFKCLWSFAKVDGGYAIFNLYGKQYMGEYGGEGADNAPMLCGDKVPYTILLNGDGTIQIRQADTWDAQNSFITFSLDSKVVMNTLDDTEGQTLWSLTPVPFDIADGYYYIKTSANNVGKADAYMFNNLAWWQLPQLSGTMETALPTTPTEKETVYIFKVERMNNGYSIQSVINNKYVGSVCQSYYLGYNADAQQIDLMIQEKGETGDIYQLKNHSSGSSIVPGDEGMDEGMWCCYENFSTADKDESVLEWEFVKLDLTESQLSTLLKSKPFIPQCEYQGNDIDEGYYYLKAADCVTTKPGTVAKFGYLTRSDNKQYPYIVHGSAEVDLITDDIVEDMYPYLFKVEKAEAGMGYTFKNMQSNLYLGLDNGAPSACLWHAAASETPSYFTLFYSEDQEAYQVVDNYTLGNQYNSYLATGNETFLWYAETTGAQNTYWQFIKVEIDDDVLAKKVAAFEAACKKYLDITESAQVSDKPGYVSDAQYIETFKTQIEAIKSETDLTSLEEILNGISALNEAMSEFVSHVNPFDVNKLYCIRSASEAEELKGQPIYVYTTNGPMAFGDYDLEDDPTLDTDCLWSISQSGSNYYLCNVSTSQYMGGFQGDNEAPVMTDEAVAYKLVFLGNGQINMQQVNAANPESYLSGDIESCTVINSDDNEAGKLNWYFEEVSKGLEAGYYYIQTAYNNTAYPNAYLYYDKSEAQRKALLTDENYYELDFEPTAAEKDYIYKIQPLDGGGYTIQSLVSGEYLGGQQANATHDCLVDQYVLFSKNPVRIDLKMLTEIDEQNKICVMNAHELEKSVYGTTIVPGIKDAKTCLFQSDIPAPRDISSYNWTFTKLDIDDAAAKEIAEGEYEYEYAGDMIEDGFYYLKACDTNPTNPGTVAKFEYVTRSDKNKYPYIIHGPADTELITSDVPESLYPFVFEVKMSEDMKGYTIKTLLENRYMGFLNGAPSACLWHVAASETPSYFTLKYDEDHDAFRIYDNTQGNRFGHVLATGNESFLWYAETTGIENTYWQFVKIDDESLTGIIDQKVVGPVTNDNKFYDLNGMVIDKPLKGKIYIRNRRKVLNK